MGIHNKVYLGKVETINTNAMENEPFVEHKIVALKLKRINSVNNKPEFRPLRKYSQYYKIVTVEPLNGYVTDNMINQKIKEKGLPEVKILKKVA